MNTNNNNIMNSTALKTYENEKDLFIKLVLNRKFINGISNKIYKFLNKDLEDLISNNKSNSLIKYVYYNLTPKYRINNINKIKLIVKENNNKLIRNYYNIKNININKYKKDYKNSIINLLNIVFTEEGFILMELNKWFIISFSRDYNNTEKKYITMIKIKINKYFYDETNYYYEFKENKFLEYINEKKDFITNNEYKTYDWFYINENKTEDLILINEMFFKDNKYKLNIIKFMNKYIKYEDYNNEEKLKDLKKYYFK